MSTNWLPIDPSKLKTDEDSQEGSVRFRVFVSPIDVPERVRGGYDETIQRFVIEFAYPNVGHEPVARQHHDAYVVLIIGRKSKRLHRIEVDTKALKAKRVQLQIEAAQELRESVSREVTEALEQLASAAEQRP